MTRTLNVGIAGLGTVGAETVRVLGGRAGLIEARTGCAIRVTAVSARDRTRDRGLCLDGIDWLDDAVALARRRDIDVVVELIGGAEGVALSLAETAIASGKSLVTANKALIAHHGTRLAQAAEAAGVGLAFEAAVAGGIPILKSLREGLAANRYARVYGILNGTCNYILSAMRESGRDFAEVLAEAQALGYAEADPAFDIDGVDAAHKLSILAAIAFGRAVDFANVHVEGIRQVSPLDIRFAQELGYRIKLLGIAEQTEAGTRQRVHPCMVPATAPIAQVEGVLNAVEVDGDAVGSTLFQGPGAGGGPTASAVVADLIDLARSHRPPAFGVPARDLSDAGAAGIDSLEGRYYIRLTVIDRPGVLADLTAVFRDREISVESILQHGRDPGEAVSIVLVTHETDEAAMRDSLAEIEHLEPVLEPPRMLRIVFL